MKFLRFATAIPRSLGKTFSGMVPKAAAAGSDRFSNLGLIFGGVAAAAASGLAIADDSTTSQSPFTGKELKNMTIFAGNANTQLAEDIARHLGLQMGNAKVREHCVKGTKVSTLMQVSRFADGEVNVMVHDNVRGKDVYIIQPTSPPVNEHLMELLLMVSTMRRASARRITCVIPYYGYARQDRKV